MGSQTYEVLCYNGRFEDDKGLYGIKTDLIFLKKEIPYPLFTDFSPTCADLNNLLQVEPMEMVNRQDQLKC